MIYKVFLNERKLKIKTRKKAAKLIRQCGNLHTVEKATAKA